MSEPTGRVCVASNALFQYLGDEAVLLSQDQGRYYGLDPIATRMWQLLAEHGDPEAVVKQMCAEFDVDETVLRADLAAFIAKMVAAELLVVA